MSRRALAIFAACVVGLAPPTTKSAAAAKQIETCTAASAKTATVHEIAVGGRGELGRCVTITAVMNGQMLFGGLDGLYGPMADLTDPSSSGNTLGLDFGLSKRPRKDGYWKVTVTGRIQDCQQARDIAHSYDTPTQIAFVIGYCHYYNGPYLRLTGLTNISKSDWERQLRSDDHPDYGNLVEAPADWPYRQQVEDRTNQFLDALAKRDGKALVALHSAEPGIVLPNLPEAQRSLLRLLIHDPASPFVAVGRMSGKPETVILLDRGYSEGDRYRSIICFCRGNNCMGRWPIDRRDADNLPGRPYACTELTPFILYPNGEATVFMTQRLAGGLREPSLH